MNGVRDRQNYRWMENEVNNTNRVPWVRDIWLEDLASYLEKNLGINDSGFESKTQGSKKIYDPYAIDVQVIESTVLSWEDEVKEESPANQFLKSQWRKWKDRAIALVSKAKKALVSAS